MSNKKTVGRPRKYAEPSSPVTLTLPHNTLDRLRLIDEDCAQAIVKLTNSAMEQKRLASQSVEIVKMADNTGLIVIGHCPPLKRIPFLELIEVAPGRFLLALKDGEPFSALEIAIQDVLDDLPSKTGKDHDLLTDLLENVRNLRRAQRVSTAEILFVKLH